MADFDNVSLRRVMLGCRALDAWARARGKANAESATKAGDK